MNKLFLDANILVDYTTKREPFYKDSKSIFKKINEGKFEGSFSMISASITAYYTQKAIGRDKSLAVFERLKKLCEVLPALQANLDWALTSGFSDLEDAMQNHIAESNGYHTIITRNKKDFKKSNLAILTPQEFLAAL